MTKRVLKPSRRHILAGIPRAQWDGLHPGPIAPRVRPNAVDGDGVRYELLRVEGPGRRVRAWARLPTAEQRRIGCLLCNGRHDPKNVACVRLMGRRVKRGQLLRVGGDRAGAPWPDFWQRVSLLVAPRYRSGSAEFVRTKSK
jgi:hypothetical protein